jgi:membrane-bound ClpP family serine protease
MVFVPIALIGLFIILLGHSQLHQQNTYYNSLTEEQQQKAAKLWVSVCTDRRHSSVTLMLSAHSQ